MARKVTTKTFGILILLTGIIVGILPFVPGILIILVGLEILGIREDVVSKIKVFFTRTPKVHLVKTKLFE